MRGGSGDGPAMVTIPASASLNIMTADDSISDDVFDVDDEESSSVINVQSGGLTPGGTVDQSSTTAPSPTGYRDYKPPAEVLDDSYTTTYESTSDFDSVRSALKRDQERDDGLAHKTILLGDSGVGKTSLLVQFDTGRYQPGNFAATVGIGFTRTGRLRGIRREPVTRPTSSTERARGRNPGTPRPRSRHLDCPNFHHRGRLVVRHARRVVEAEERGRGSNGVDSFSGRR